MQLQTPTSLQHSTLKQRKKKIEKLMKRNHKLELIYLKTLLSVSNQHPTGTTAGFTFGGRPLGLGAPVAGAGADEVPTLGFFGGRPRGFPLPEEAFFGGETGANGSLGFGGRPLGLGGARTVPGGRGTLGLGGRPRPLRGGALGSGFM